MVSPSIVSCLHLSHLCIILRHQTSPDITSFKLVLHFHLCFTFPSPCMGEPILLNPPWSSPLSLLFWQPYARYLFKFLTPHGDRYVPLFPLSPSLVFSACLCLSYVHQYMYEAANVDSTPPTWGVQPTHFTGQSQLNHFQVVQPLEVGKPQLWLLQPTGQKQLGG